VIAQLPSWPTNRPAALQRKAFSTSALTDIQEPQHPVAPAPDQTFLEPRRRQNRLRWAAACFRCAKVRRVHPRARLPAQITHIRLKRLPSLTRNDYASCRTKKGYSAIVRRVGCELVKRECQVYATNEYRRADENKMRGRRSPVDLGPPLDRS